MNSFLAITCLFVGLFAAAAANCGSLRNLSEGKPARQSSTYKDGNVPAAASRALDNNWNSAWSGKSCSHTLGDKDPWWEVHLGNTYTVYAVMLKNREDCCSHRLSNIAITVDGKECNQHVSAVGKYAIISCKTPLSGRTVRVTLKKAREYLTLCEVNVLGH